MAKPNRVVSAQEFATTVAKTVEQREYAQPRCARCGKAQPSTWMREEYLAARWQLVCRNLLDCVARRNNAGK